MNNTKTEPLTGIKELNHAIYGYLEDIKYAQVLGGIRILGGFKTDLQTVALLNRAYHCSVKDYCMLTKDQPLSLRIMKNSLNSMFYCHVDCHTLRDNQWIASHEEILCAIVETVHQIRLSTPGKLNLNQLPLVDIVSDSTKSERLAYILSVMNIGSKALLANVLKGILRHDVLAIFNYIMTNPTCTGLVESNTGFNATKRIRLLLGKSKEDLSKEKVALQGFCDAIEKTNQAIEEANNSKQQEIDLYGPSFLLLLLILGIAHFWV